MTCLMLAAIKLSVEAVRILIPLESGYQSKNGITALIFAIKLKNTEVIKMLAQSEAYISDSEGNTALMQYVKYFSYI